MKLIWGVSAIVFVILAVFIVYFNSTPKLEPEWEEAEDGSLPVVGTKTNLNNYFQEIIKEQKNSRTLFGFQENAIDSKASDTAASADSAGKQTASETNIQVNGVDEGDLVKTNGEHIFQVSQNKVNIIKAIPAEEMKIAASINFDQTFSPTELFLFQNQLVVIGHSNDFEAGSNMTKQSAADIMIAPVSQATKALVYNIENPEKPQQIREIKLDGSYVSARRIDGIVYLVTNQYPQYWILEDNNDIDLRPSVYDSAVSSSPSPVDYDKIQYFPNSKEANYTIIAAFSLNEPEAEAKITTYLGSGSQLYMSKDNLYLAVPRYNEKAMEELANSVVTPDTSVYKFSVNETDVKFHSTAEIPGILLNQFSMDEHDGYFRLVTTKGYAWDERQPSTNQLLILDENLKQVGMLTDLARGERIYSARFLGDKIYMVTFKETDPLFVIDVSEPTLPKLLGELKIPGFSNYLHPYDDHYLIGFGQETRVVEDKGSSGTPRVITDGVKISLFDVSDMNNPKEKFTEIIGGRGTYSPLNYDHKALLFNKNKNLFGFPISVYQNSTRNEYEQIYDYQGALLYRVNPETGFSLQIKLSHESGKGQYENWENTIQRLVTIGETLYALSPEKISAHDLSSNAELGELSLK